MAGEFFLIDLSFKFNMDIARVDHIIHRPQHFPVRTFEIRECITVREYRFYLPDASDIKTVAVLDELDDDVSSFKLYSPIIDIQSCNPIELPGVICHQNHIQRLGMCSDKHIQSAYHLAPPL